MPEPVRLEKAELNELDATFNEVPGGAKTRVQFNPETLKVSFSNQLKGDQSGTAAIQFVGAGATKLSLQLWFDVNAPQIEEPRVNDVRKLTQRIAYYMLPGKTKAGKTKAPPAVRFLWGTFVFDGVMESLEETLEMFSPDGRPLRASVTVGLTRQRVTFSVIQEDQGRQRSEPPVGAKPLAQATSGSTVQSLASNAGKGDDWQEIAAANGIENPRQLKPGQVVDLNPVPVPRKR